MMPKEFDEDCGQRRSEIIAVFRSCGGSVAVEFALVAPIVVLIAAGIVDFGMLATESAGLVATTRIGAEYARRYPDDTGGIQQVMQRAMSVAPALAFPASFMRHCECNDETPIACGQSCATAGRPVFNRAFIRITASQPFTPLVPWPGIPSMLAAATEVRLQ
jgi:hypothetical protein